MASPSPPISDVCWGLAVISGTIAVVALAVAFGAAPAQGEIVELPVPYHAQVESWYCAEAALQMVFDYWGEEIPQHDIGDVANERRVGGTYVSDLRRAALFSNISYAIQDREEGGDRLHGYDQRPLGYSAHVHEWTGSRDEAKRYEQLMDLIRGGYPIIMLTWFDSTHSIMHYRVLKGFDDLDGDFIVHDPQKGSDLRYNMTALVDDLWTCYDRWAMVVVPWSVTIQVPDMVGRGEEFEVWGRVEYPCPVPFFGQDPGETWPRCATATVTIEAPFSLASGEDRTKELNIARGGDVDVAVWRVVAPDLEGFWRAGVEVQIEARAGGRAISYGQYTDRVGGKGVARVECDAAPPKIEGLEVADGEPLVRDPTVTVTYEVLDAHSGVDAVRLSTDGGANWGNWTEPTGEQVLVLSGGDGDHTVALMVRDRVGNLADASRSLVLDTTQPSIFLFEIAGGAEIITEGNVPVHLVASDATTSVELMALRVGTAAWMPWEPYREQLQLELGGDGDREVWVRVRDSVGNVASASASVLLDSTPPYITHMEVEGGAPFVLERTVEVSFGAVDNLDQELEYALREDSSGGQGFSPTRVVQSGGQLAIVLELGGEGTRVVTLTVRDHAGHTAEATAEVLVDTVPPVVSVVLNGGREVARTTEIPIAVSALDATSGVERARLRVDEGEWGPWLDLGAIRHLDLGFGEGLRTVEVEAQDTVGNPTRALDTVFVDTVPPTATVTYTQMEEGGAVAVGSEIVVNFSEPMDASGLEVLLVDNSSGILGCSLVWSESDTLLTITPKGRLSEESYYVLSVIGSDVAGNPLGFRGAVFGTPGGPEEWELHLPEDTMVLLLVFVFVIGAAVALVYGVARGKRKG